MRARVAGGLRRGQTAAGPSTGRVACAHHRLLRCIKGGVAVLTFQDMFLTLQDTPPHAGSAGSAPADRMDHRVLVLSLLAARACWEGTDSAPVPDIRR